MSEPDGKNGEDKQPKPAPVEIVSVTHHKLHLPGADLKYTVTAGTAILKEEDEETGEKPKASIFFIAYTLEDVPDTKERPITFSFNGGPGSSSVWLHLGVLGPRRVLLDKDGNPPPPPYRLTDNQYSLLTHSDLVFIDPVSTGYSRPVPGEKAEDFHSVKKDIQSVGDFIHLYTSRNQRWLSPKFIIGESYGTTRAAGLSSYMQERHGMFLNGIMLISSILNFGTTQFNPGNDLPYLLFLPTYTATAWYHQKLDPDLQKDLSSAMKFAEEFAYGEYALALMQGSALDEKTRAAIIQKLARLTGLSETYIDQTDLRVNIHRFCKQLLRDQGLTVGRLDSRFTGHDRDDAGETFERDPSYSAILGPYAGALNQYVREELDVEFDIPYEILAPLYQKWRFEDQQNQYLNVAEDLRKAIATNPALRVFVGNGYYDLATPYWATKYTFDHIGLESNQSENVTMSFYEAGHMMYIHQPSLEKMYQDLIEFVDKSSNISS
jgi:carboxypeptidase C (cathepsin A)